MTDREMLELAAKAGGVSGYRYSENFCCMAHWNESDGGWFDACGLWDPLRDDGDAFRLAVKLGLTINVTGMFVHADCCNRDNDIGYFEENSARNGGCILKAARRAIVRAAAATGEEMK